MSLLLRSIVEIEHAQPKTRIKYIDLARGVAVGLMILSHGVKALLPFEKFPPWGLVPIHLITKFSSSLFFLVFGLSLALIFAPQTETEEWPRRRNKLLMRGLVILFWYKILTIVEYFQFGGRQQILDSLSYKSFTSFVEILGYYAIAFLWIPFVLPLWRRLPIWILLFVPALFLGLHFFISTQINFGDNLQLKALLVEDQRFYTWGQISRAPIVFLGMIVGTLILKNDERGRGIWGSVTLILGLVMFGAFYYQYQANLQGQLIAIAMNEGKHPPTFDYVLFSLAGAFSLLGLCLLGGNALAELLRPVTIIGEDALQSFIFHIFVIFVVYRYLFNLFHNITYQGALQLTILLLILTPIWIGVRKWVVKKA